MIDALNGAEYVRVAGTAGNITDMRVSLWQLQDPEKEAVFENCCADVNIPVGEVFTSPVLKGTYGRLQVSSAYLGGYHFENITIDGDFYSASAQATLTFQQNMGFPAEELTSVVGIWTWYYLFGYGAYTSYDPPVQCTIDYSNHPVIDPSYLPLLNQNKHFYEATEQTTGVPWEILAAIHYREYKFNCANPNGHGPYEIDDYNYAWIYPTDAQFQQATDDCALFLMDKMTQNRIRLRTMYETENKLRKDEVKKLFYVYNGASYYNQAISKGFTPYEANIGEGSPYVMNRADLPRDPTVYPTISDGTWGQRMVNGGPIVYPATSDYGAYLVFCALYDE